jgi:predicted Rossmann fold nucleotide-binding protein DprA/Smf involved in DNA uptake
MPETLRNPREVFRDAFLMQQRIAALLREEPRTIPSIAAALQAPTREVMLWLMAMLRYGVVEARGKADGEGYFRYALKEVEPWL